MYICLPTLNIMKNAFSEMKNGKNLIEIDQKLDQKLLNWSKYVQQINYLLHVFDGIKNQSLQRYI